MRRANTVPLHLMSAAALIALAGLIGCPAQTDEPPADDGRAAKIELTSTAFPEGQPIPRQYTGEGADVSPPLAWASLPEGTRELILICDDPDAPGGTWVHWVIYGIPASATGLPEDFSGTGRSETEAQGIAEGMNSFGNVGYGGPMPPPGGGKHRYLFKLCALDIELDLEPGLDKQSVLEAIEGHILGEGRLMGTYER